MFHTLFNPNIYDLSKKYSIPIYLHAVNSLDKIANYLKDVKGVYTGYISKTMLNKYISNINKKLL